MISISWIPIGKKNLLGVSQFPGKNLQNIFDLSSFLKDLQIIKKQKVKIVVSLLPDNEKNKLGLDDLIWSKEEVEYIQFPINDFSVPPKKKFNELKKLISFIKENLMLSKHVLIHCNGGKGRSGMIAALVLKAMKEKDPIKKVREKVIGAIETEEQEIFVKDWV
jgi:protein-tyrosine phosphatase|tara:strand:+ start:163 stop:654 length:492 start_codon:yes stop_codon:yes gene_type:complete